MASKLSKFLLEMCPVQGHKRLDDDAFLASLSLSLQESGGVVFSIRLGAVLLKHKKSSPDNLHMSDSDF